VFASAEEVPFVDEVALVEASNTFIEEEASGLLPSRAEIGKHYYILQPFVFWRLFVLPSVDMLLETWRQDFCCKFGWLGCFGPITVTSNTA
jgi:hypothetical protein